MWVGATASKCDVERSPSCLHWRTGVKGCSFMPSVVIVSRWRVAGSLDAITLLLFPTSPCMCTPHPPIAPRNKDGNSSFVRQNNQYDNVFPIHLQAVRCMSPTRVIHFNAAAGIISHCSVLLSDVEQHRHPLAALSHIQFQPVCNWLSYRRTLLPCQSRRAL